MKKVKITSVKNEGITTFTLKAEVSERKELMYIIRLVFGQIKKSEVIEDGYLTITFQSDDEKKIKYFKGGIKSITDKGLNQLIQNNQK